MLTQTIIDLAVLAPDDLVKWDQEIVGQVGL
jgi:hypothetical protein